MEPLRFPTIERQVRRGWVAATLTSIAVLVPLAPALSLATEGNRGRWAPLMVWGIGAAAGALFAIAAAVKPRLGRVLAGLAILEIILIVATYVVVAVASSH